MAMRASMSASCMASVAASAASGIPMRAAAERPPTPAARPLRLAFFSCMSLIWFRPGRRMLNATHPRAGPRITRKTRARLSTEASWEISVEAAFACWAPRERAPARVRAAVCCVGEIGRVLGDRAGQSKVAGVRSSTRGKSPAV